MAVVGLFKASLTLTITFWCCLEKHVSGSTADTGSDVISSISKAATTGLSVHEGRLDAGGVMAAADLQSVIRKASESSAGEQRSRSRTYCRTDTFYLLFILNCVTDERTSDSTLKSQRSLGFKGPVHPNYISTAAPSRPVSLTTSLLVRLQSFFLFFSSIMTSFYVQL